MAKKLDSAAVADAEGKLIVFRLGQQAFAIDIGAVAEVGELTEITRVPLAPGFVEGVIDVRGIVLPLIDLRQRFGIAAEVNTGDARIIQVVMGQRQLGFVVDAVTEILPYDPAKIEPPRDVMASVSTEYMRGFIRAGERLIIVVDLERALSFSEQAELAETDWSAIGGEADGTASDVKADSEATNGTKAVDTRLVVFRLANETYGVQVDTVESIAELPAVTRVPGTPAYLSGVINLRGRVIAVIDLRRRLGLATAEHSVETRIIVVEFGDEQVGLLVDDVAEILPVSLTSVEPLNEMMTGANSEFITGTLKTEDSLVILLDLARILLREERRTTREKIA
jgi:purine-binding chemotaxis protein CheW